MFLTISIIVIFFYLWIFYIAAAEVARSYEDNYKD